MNGEHPPYRVLVTGAGGAVMSLRWFVSSDQAASFVRGVMVGYWWRPVIVQDTRVFSGRQKPEQPAPASPAHSTRLEVWWHADKLIDRPLHDMTDHDLKPLVEMWRTKGAA
jgi:hypothetical protein